VRMKVEDCVAANPELPSKTAGDAAPLEMFAVPAQGPVTVKSSFEPAFIRAW